MSIVESNNNTFTVVVICAIIIIGILAITQIPDLITPPDGYRPLSFADSGSVQDWQHHRTLSEEESGSNTKKTNKEMNEEVKQMRQEFWDIKETIIETVSGKS